MELRKRIQQTWKHRKESETDLVTANMTSLLLTVKSGNYEW